MSALSIIIVLSFLHLLLMAFILKSKRLEKFGIGLSVPFILWHTGRGKNFLDRGATHRRFWDIFYPVSLILCLVSMVGMITLLLFNLYVIATEPNLVGGIDPRMMVALPGINPIIPLGYGLVAFILTLLFHELSHGVVYRHQNITVKSMGLLFFILPLGAFVEPDEKELEAAEPSRRLRVYLAGPGMNIIVGIVCLLALALLAGTMSVEMEGLFITAISENSPAAFADMRVGDVIISLNGTLTGSSQVFNELISEMGIGDVISLEIFRNGEIMEKSFALADMGRISGLAEDVGRAWMGIIYSSIDLGVFAGIFANPLSITNLMTILVAPFVGAIPFSEPLLQFYNTPFSAQTFSTIANLFYWTFWMNFLVGTFNVLPISILDGYSIFRDSLLELGRKLNIAQERREKLATRVSRVFSWFFGIVVMFVLIVSLI